MGAVSTRAPSSADEAAIVALLRAEGAGALAHGGGRSLLEHLLETCRILRRWGQPVWLQHAALIHSVYGTEAYDRQLISLARRAEVAAAAGARAERLGYLFHVVPRRPLLAGTHRWARELPLRPGASGDDDPPTRDELDALVLLHMANLAEQARAADGSPGRWLGRVVSLAELLRDSDSVTPPLFTAQLAAFGASEEALTRTTYMEALPGEREARTGALALTAALCPVVPEPCIWLAYLALMRGDAAAAQAWSAQASKRLSTLGTPWDKRLSFEQWEELAGALSAEEGAPLAERALRAERDPQHPRALFDAVIHGATSKSRAVRRPGIRPPDPEAGRRRFQRYVEGLADADAAAAAGGPRRIGAIYPDLPSRPWHDPHDFPIVRDLESQFDAVRAELLALQDDRFHRESERISRTGDWDVAFLYERGRRRDEVCAACPVTTRAIETHRAIRTLAGLSYVSRMRGGTHIEAHRGPTNLRVRCHLALEVPDGDCAISVGGETRRWVPGSCLVFDDYFVHEAWNHTDQDRLVLIVDLWHPGLSDTEVRLLEALHAYAHGHATRLSRYWSANARAARQAAQDGPYAS
jgi:aspartate beta-hydroxylase